MAAADEGFHAIFDGQTLDGWDGNPKLLARRRRHDHGQTTPENPAKGNTFLIWRGGKPADFELKAEFRMPNAGFANSGIQIRSWEGPQKWRVSGYQPDMDGDNQHTGICYGENYRGVLARAARKRSSAQTTNQELSSSSAMPRNSPKSSSSETGIEYDIIARGNHIIQKINGQLMCEVTDEDTVARKDGIIALQLHAGPPMKVQFRNIRLKELTPGNSK